MSPKRMSKQEGEGETRVFHLPEAQRAVVLYNSNVKAEPGDSTGLLFKLERTWPIPIPEKPDDCIIKVGACVLLPGDAELARGEGSEFVEFPYVPGYAVAGTVVVEARDGLCKRFRVGDFVAGILPLGTLHGGCEEYCVALEHFFVPIPEGMTFLRAALAVSGLRSFLALHHFLHMRAGKSLLVLGGASHFGHIAIQLAACLGTKVFATAHTDREVDLLQGYRQRLYRIIDLRKESVSEVVLVETGNLGVNAVLDARIHSEILRVNAGGVESTPPQSPPPRMVAKTSPQSDRPRPASPGSPGEPHVQSSESDDGSAPIVRMMNPVPEAQEEALSVKLSLIENYVKPQLPRLRVPLTKLSSKEFEWDSDRVSDYASVTTDDVLSCLSACGRVCSMAVPAGPLSLLLPPQIRLLTLKGGSIGWVSDISWVASSVMQGYTLNALASLLSMVNKGDLRFSVQVVRPLETCGEVFSMLDRFGAGSIAVVLDLSPEHIHDAPEEAPVEVAALPS